MNPSSVQISEIIGIILMAISFILEVFFSSSGLTLNSPLFKYDLESVVGKSGIFKIIFYCFKMKFKKFHQAHSYRTDCKSQNYIFIFAAKSQCFSFYAVFYILKGC